MTSGHPVRRVAKGDAAAVSQAPRAVPGVPEANEKTSRTASRPGSPARARCFAMLDNHHHGSPHLSVWLPMPPGLQDTLVGADPERCFRPPYVGPAGWIGVVLDSRPDWELVGKLLPRRLPPRRRGEVAGEALLGSARGPDAAPAPGSRASPRGRRPRTSPPTLIQRSTERPDTPRTGGVELPDGPETTAAAAGPWTHRRTSPSCCTAPRRGWGRRGGALPGDPTPSCDGWRMPG